MSLVCRNIFSVNVAYALVLSFTLVGVAHGDSKSTKTPQTDATNELGLADSVEQASAAGRYALPDIAKIKAWKDVESFEDEGYQRLVKYIPRLEYDRAGRWPVLVWAKETGAGDQLQAWIDRGISPLFNYHIEKNIPAWKQMQSQDVPVIFLLQGHVQRLFRYNKRSKSKVNHDHHVEPAKGECPAYLVTHPHLQNEGQRIEKIYRKLHDAGVEVDAVLLDFESGAYLRNGAEKEEKVRQAMAQAIKCSRCVEQFGESKLSSADSFRALCDESRAQATRIASVEPLAKVFPDAKIGNFFAWPIHRYIDGQGVLDPSSYETLSGSYPAYGYAGSGMNISQPRCYYVHGWQSWGMPETVTDQQMVDWNVFTYTINRFSLAARVSEPGEVLVPWVGWLWGHSFRNNPDPNLKAASAQGYKEAVVHTLLRGAETVAVFAPAKLTDDFKEDYSVDRKEMGPFLRNLADVQAGYNEVLRFQPFIATAKPLNLQHHGVVNEPGVEWSGYGTDEVSLVRTVSFKEPVDQSISLYGHVVTLPFRQQGTWFWVFPDGHWVDAE